MLLNPGVRLQTAHSTVVRVKDRAGGDYSVVFGAYMANQKINFNDTDPSATGGVSVSFATLNSGSGLGSNAKAVFSVGEPAVMSSGSPADDDEVEIFYIESGFGFFWGTRPKAKSRRVYTGGDGTKFLIYIEPGTFPTVEHIVLVDPVNSDAARVYKLDAQGQPGASPDVTLTTAALRYAKLNVNGTFDTSATVPAPIQAIVDFAKQQALGAGY
jgi:hypothetical protein